MEQILDFSKPLDVSLFDKVVACMYSSTNQAEIQAAQRVLTQFQNHPQAWTRVDKILEQSNNMNAKYIALQILDNVIKYKWKIIPSQQQTGIKNYIVNTIIKRSSNPETLVKEKVYIRKLDEVLVQIIKQEWPRNWTTFIPEIVGSSKTNESLCENNMIILKLLSEEIFDFSSGEMTQQKIKELKESFNKEFSMIYQLCEFILNKASKPSLIIATLQTLLRFLNWIPLGYIFETKMIENLVTRFLPLAPFRNDSLRCLTEIAGINAPNYNPQLEIMYIHVIKVLFRILPPQTDIAKAYKSGNNYDQQFVQILALFLTSFFKNHLTLIEKKETGEALLAGHNYLVEISKVDDTEVFKTCLEYWNFLAQDLYFSTKKQSLQAYPLLLDQSSTRKDIYAQILSKVRLVMISKMAKPEEVIIVEDENGDLIKEYMKDVDSIQLYKSMRETLIYLTHLDHVDTENIMIAKLEAQVNGTEWSWKNLNTLCWAIGSISGAMEEKDEKRFLVSVIKDLLSLCDLKKGKENKAVVASNIMYVVGQYPRFLIAHWKFLKTVVNKLYEFMHETFPGVQEMACDTFLKIAKQCRQKFIQIHPGEKRPFVEDTLLDLPQIISDLEPPQIHTFYEALGYMISAAQDVKKEALIFKLMELPNQRWSGIMKQAAISVGNLQQPEILRDLVNLLKTNVAAAKSLKGAYIFQLRHIFRDMLEVYRAYSQAISQEVAKNGVNATKFSHVRAMRAVKKEILKLLETFILNADDTQVVAKHFMPPLLEATLGDYHHSVPDARDPGVLSVIASAMKKLKGDMAGEMARILESVLECTLPMITKNFQDYPEHRTNFFNLLRNINKYCFQSFFTIPPQGFKLIVDSFLWAIKHTERGISETGLMMLLDLIHNIEQASKQNPKVVNSFYQSFYVTIIQDVLYVLTDTFHKSGFNYQTRILCHLCSIIANNSITVPIYDLSKFPNVRSNQEFLQNYIGNLLSKSFPNLAPQQIQNFVVGLFTKCNDANAYKIHLQDFLVELRVWTPQDRQSAQEAETNQQRLAMKHEQMKMVPGLLKPDKK